ncbi:unnamed protein product [Didymodactylos carnosus]|uniref:Uncharacterized protein n=1 Tax=Didymodactylos carnosus TaxID=1234261 RepID=A0A814DR20_9BILA|nr:unnamed protein product [Didymodactylos carnosus]CAF3733880.1 unnamed protein product [Didymodactylos carnosus]
MYVKAVEISRKFVESFKPKYKNCQLSSLTHVAIVAHLCGSNSGSKKLFFRLKRGPNACKRQNNAKSFFSRSNDIRTRSKHRLNAFPLFCRLQAFEQCFKRGKKNLMGRGAILYCIVFVEGDDDDINIDNTFIENARSKVDKLFFLP